MAAAQRNKPGVDRKEWETMNPCPTATGAGHSVIGDPSNTSNTVMVVSTTTAQYLYHQDEGSFVEVPPASFAVAPAAGTCGTQLRWSNTVTATGGSTTTITTAANISGMCIGKKVRFLTGLNIGLERTITGALIIPGGTSTLSLDSALPNAVVNTNTFAVDVNTFFVLNAGTLASGYFKSYDQLTGTWTNLSITGLPATWGTDGGMCSTPSSGGVFGTITSPDIFSSTTVGKASKTWTVNQWCNSQARIVSGTGVGQLPRTIASNTATTLTVSAAWTITPDATSVIEITGNDDALYLCGNANIITYKYNRTANTWATMAPTVARGGAPGLGMGVTWVGKTGDATWADENNIQDGRYLYSFRGGTALDRLDIAGGTGGAGSWLNIAYPGLSLTFGAGSAFDAYGRYIYCRQNSTNRFFKFSVRGNYMEPLAFNFFPEGTAVAGKKLWVWSYTDSGGTSGVLQWVYSLQNTGQMLHRLPLY